MSLSLSFPETSAMKQPSTSLAASGNALALAIANPGALGTIDAYISAVNRLPVLSAERETELGRRLRDQEDRPPPASWCCRTCAWWFPWRASISATACRMLT